MTQKLWTPTFAGRAIVAVVAAMLTLASCGGSAGPSSTTAGSQPAGDSSTTVTNGAPEGTKHYAGLSQQHTGDPVHYDQNPPVGGPHNPVWQPCGYYDAPIETERGVHSLEHGAVWITYSPGLAADQVAVLKTMVAGHTHLLVSPYVGLPSPVVASAWGEQLFLPTVTDPRLAAFVAYFEEGPQTPEPGARCN